ncbi:MAG: hypothetical protein AAGF66_16250, partial [Cyanobacteria bacterium P01_H01_bin.119]
NRSTPTAISPANLDLANSPITQVRVKHIALFVSQPSSPSKLAPSLKPTHFLGKTSGVKIYLPSNAQTAATYPSGDPLSPNYANTSNMLKSAPAMAAPNFVESYPAQLAQSPTSRAQAYVAQPPAPDIDSHSALQTSSRHVPSLYALTRSWRSLRCPIN